MRALLHIPIAVTALALLAACGGTNEAPKEDGKAAEAARRIRTMEDSLFNNPVFDRKGAQALLDVYLAFEKNNIGDTLAPEYAFRAAGLEKALGEPQASIAQMNPWAGTSSKFDPPHEVPDSFGPCGASASGMTGERFGARPTRRRACGRRRGWRRPPARPGSRRGR